MKTYEITQADIDIKNEYCSRARLKELMKTKSFEEIVSEDIIMFFSHVLGMPPYAWQYRVLKAYNGDVRKFVICTSRQIGKSIMVAGIVLYRISLNKGYEDRQAIKNRLHNTTEMIMSRGDDQAKTLLKEIKNMIYQADEYMENSYMTKGGKSVFGRKWFSSFLSTSRDGNNLQSIAFKSNLKSNSKLSKGIEYNNTATNEAKSMPPTEIVLGKTYTGIYLDEASRIDDTVYTEWASPTIKAVGKLQVFTSTPFRPDGFFYHALDPDEVHDVKFHKFDRFMFDLDAIKIEDPEQYNDVKEEIDTMIEQGKVNEVNRNYYCKFTSSDAMFFPQDKIAEVFDSDIRQVSRYIERPVLVGVDFGGLAKSHSVITIVTSPDEAGVSERIGCWRYPVKKDVDITQDILNNIIPNFKVHAIIVDDCPAGKDQIQLMKRHNMNVIEFSFNRASKPEYMSKFRTGLSTGRFTSYVDQALKTEFANYNDDMKPMSGATDDMIDSWMLACYPLMNEKSAAQVLTIGGDDKLTQKSADAELEALKSQVEGKFLGGAIAI